MLVASRTQLSVAVIGFGYVGSCVAAVLADQGADVVGIDADPRLVDEIAAGHCRFREHGLAELIRSGTGSGRLRVTTDFTEVAGADLVLITVGTPIREGGVLADEQLRGACEELSRHLRRGQLVVLKSTVPPGTTQDVVRPILERSGLRAGRDFGLAFIPERLAEGTAIRELTTFPVVVGGSDRSVAEDVARVWRDVFGVDVIPMDSLESAEIVKLADNWWIDLNIALANELAKFCALYGVDVLDVIKAANTIPKGKGNVNILQPSVGVGGSCLTKDPWMVWRSARQHGLDILTAPAGREVNAGMPGYAADLVVSELTAQGKDPARATVAVLGLAFKNNTGDLRATPTVSFVEELCRLGARVRLHDPLVEPEDGLRTFGAPLTEDLHDAVRDADCVAVLALHRELEAIDFATLPVAEGCLVLDGRAHYPREKIAQLRDLGYRYRGIGR